jgi:predicted transcriptional regulator
MAGEKRFRIALYGFKKEDVNSYIEKIVQKFEISSKEKDEEISKLREEYKELKVKYDELIQTVSQINEDRARIADVLIKAEEKAQLVIEEAKAKATEEKNKIEEIVEKEKERLVEIKEEMRTLKSDIVTTLRKYDSQLGTIIEEK